MRLALDRTGLTRGQAGLLASTAWASMLAGGFGSGKTTGSVYKSLQLRAVNGVTPGLMVAPTYRSLWSVWYRTLVKTMRASMGRAAGDAFCRVYDKQGECYMDWGGAPVYLRSATNPDSIDGLDVGWAGGDEPRYWPQRTLEIFYARVRQRCALSQRFFSTTPAMGWLAEEFTTGRPGRELIVAPTIENARNLEPNYVRNLRLAYSPRMQKAVLEGYFVPLEGAVYEELDPDFWKSDHVARGFDVTTRGRTYLAVDPGYRHSAWLWIREVAPHQWVVFDEIMPERMSDEACIAAVNARGWPIDEIWVDPAANATQSAMNISTMDMLQGIKATNDSPIRWIPPVFRRIELGVDKVRILLGSKELGIPIRLRFADRLEAIERTTKRGVVKDMIGYSYPDKMRALAADKPDKDGLTDHANDALRYWAVGMFATTEISRMLPRMVA